MIIRNLKKTFRRRKNSVGVTAVNGINLTLPDNGIVFITGKSGSGKSTLINLIGGLEKADEGGEIIFKDKNICKLSLSQLDEYRNSVCGFIFQEYNLIPELTVGENVALALETQGKKAEKEKIAEVLKEVELEGFEDRRIYELSGGERQRVAIARVLIREPAVILADEPTGALDSETGSNIIRILKRQAQKALILVVSHDENYTKEYADRTVQLSAGKVICDSEQNYEYAAADEKLVTLKPQFPFLSAMKIAMSNCKTHWLNFAVAILLSLICFSSVGITVTCAVTDRARIFFDYMIENNVEYVSVRPCDLISWDDFDKDDISMILRRTDGNYYNYCYLLKNISMEEADKFIAKTAQKGWAFNTQLLNSFEVCFAKPLNSEDAVDEINNSELRVSPYPCGMISGATAEDIIEAGFTLTGRMPENGDEIAINISLFNAYKILGFKEDGESYTFSRESDILGHTVPVGETASEGEKKKIVGIVDTGLKKGEILSYDSYDLIEYSFHEKIFVHHDALGWTNKILFRIKGNEEGFEKLAYYCFNCDPATEGYAIRGPSVGGFDESMYILYQVGNFLRVLCPISSAIAIILLMNFVASSVRGQTKQIGILFSLGVNTKGIFKIYLTFMLVVGLIIFIFTYPLSLILCMLVNNYMIHMEGPAMLLPNIVSPVCLIALIAAVITIGCIIPVLNLRRKPPADVIRRSMVI